MISKNNTLPAILLANEKIPSMTPSLRPLLRFVWYALLILEMMYFCALYTFISTIFEMLSCICTRFWSSFSLSILLYFSCIGVKIPVINPISGIATRIIMASFQFRINKYTTAAAAIMHLPKRFVIRFCRQFAISSTSFVRRDKISAS